MISPARRIHQAFLQLEFAIKVMRHFELGHVDKALLDRDTVIRLPEGELRYPESSFNTDRDLVLAAQNLYSSVLGLSAISLEAALSDAGIRNNPADTSPRGDLRTLVYQIRCTFAHDMMYPRWQVADRYLRELRFIVGGSKRTVDLRRLNGQLFELESVGGMLVYLEIKKELLRWLVDLSPVELPQTAGS
jgi:hypothetical protein